MSALTQTKQRDLLNTQNNTEETHNLNSKLIEREQMEDTPFWIIGNEETGYFGVMGKYQITEKFPTKEGVKNHIETKIWDIMMKVVSIITQAMLEEHDRAKENKGK